MKRATTTFLVVAVMTGLLAALSFAIRLKGYPFGSQGITRLDAIADAATFIPVAALYSFSAMLLMILPPRGAGFVYANAASPLWFTALVLLAAILGLQIARWAFGDGGALRALIDWQFIFAAAIIGTHTVLDSLRRSILLRSIFFVLFIVATLACLYWHFKL